MRPVVHASLAAALALGCIPVYAADVRITHARCAAEVRIVARDAPLSAILEKLANVLDFQLRFDSESDPHVTLDGSERAEALPARLGPSENVSVMLERDPRCAGQQRIAKVWVLPRGSGSAAAPSTIGMRQNEEQARRAREGAELILKAHGMDADGQPLPR
jgi:hypothetical protein